MSGSATDDRFTETVRTVLIDAILFQCKGLNDNFPTVITVDDVAVVSRYTGTTATDLMREVAEVVEYQERSTKEGVRTR